MSDERHLPSSGWVKMWHPKGVQVSLPIPALMLPSEMIGYINGCFEAGFLAQAAGLEAGEERETFFHVVRGVINETTHIDLYRDQDQFRFLGVYLNRPEDEAAFELASGLKIKNLREFIGPGHIERGKDKRLDAMVVTAPKPFGAVWKANPKHDSDTEEGKKKPKRLFVRWVDQRPQQEADCPADAKPADPAAETLDDAGEKIINDWTDWLRTDPNRETANAALPQIKAIESTPVRKAVWRMVSEHFRQVGVEFNEKTKQFDFATAVPW